MEKDFALVVSYYITKDMRDFMYNEQEIDQQIGKIAKKHGLIDHSTGRGHFVFAQVYRGLEEDMAEEFNKVRKEFLRGVKSYQDRQLREAFQAWNITDDTETNFWAVGSFLTSWGDTLSTISNRVLQMMGVI